MAPLEPQPTFASRSTLWVALFSGLLIVTAIILHRLAGMATPVALTLMGSGIAGAAVTILVAAFATLQLWRRQALGGAYVVAGVAIALAIVAWPAAYAPTFARLPRLHDVSTDMRTPPRYVALAARRGPAANPVAYPGASAAEAQAASYPDLKTFTMDRSAEDAFEIARDAVRRVRLQVVSEEPPLEGRRREVEGVIEAVDRTLLVGFYDDVVIRVIGDDRQARIDIRSSSRYGRHDLGRNAQRVRTLLKEIQARLEASVPGSPGYLRNNRFKNRPIQGALPRRGSAADPTKGARPPSRGPAASDARRGPEQKGTPPAREPGRARDTQDQRSPR